MAADYPKVYRSDFAKYYEVFSLRPPKWVSTFVPSFPSRLLVLISPVVDLLSMRHLDGYVHSLLGANYTRGDVFDERLVTEAWKRWHTSTSS